MMTRAKVAGGAPRWVDRPALIARVEKEDVWI